MANGRSGRTPAKDSLFTSSEAIAERKREERASFGSKVDEANAKRKAEREAKAAKRKKEMQESTARLSERKKAARLKAQKNRNPRGKGSAKSSPASSSNATTAPSAPKKNESTAKPLPKFGVGKEFTIRGGKANVTADQLKRTGLTQAQYMKQWRATNKRPTAATAKKAASAPAAKKPATKKVGLLRRVLLGKDGKFGGSRGAIDFLPGKSRPKKKAMGGMMKSKMASKGGARGGRRVMGMKMGGTASKKFPDLSGDGKVTQKDILMGKGVVKKKAGGMAKKGYAKGGAAMKKKGYSRGGAVSKKPTKPRGVGAAKRGYGRAMK